MNLPKIIADLVRAQANADGRAFADCFSQTAVVYDEGKTHEGKAEIQNWIEQASRAYKTVLKPLDYSETKHTLKAEISGTFPGSPIVVTYSFTLGADKIESLKIE